MQSVKVSDDLVTNKKSTISGFSWQAEEKVSRAQHYVSHAEHFKKQAINIKNIDDIRKDLVLTEFIIAACMLSKKSLSHLNIDTQNKIIENLIDFNKLDDLAYQNQLEQRYFLTSGDSLGGTMRNVVGQFAQENLTESIIARLETLGKQPERILNKSHKTVGIKWHNRCILFDKKPKFINKSIDIIVVKGNSAKEGYLEEPKDYICCGELKGGIDPAGADEHWKTAKSALARIDEAFKTLNIEGPKLVFLGSAIETAMSKEIFSLLETQWLSGAANINYADQFNEVIDLIIS